MTYKSKELIKHKSCFNDYSSVSREYCLLKFLKNFPDRHSFYSYLNALSGYFLCTRSNLLLLMFEVIFKHVPQKIKVQTPRRYKSYSTDCIPTYTHITIWFIISHPFFFNGVGWWSCISF